MSFLFVLTGQPILPDTEIWKAEHSRCIVARDALDEWTTETSHRRLARRSHIPTQTKDHNHRKAKQSSIVRRPHVLKIDTEGQVLFYPANLRVSSGHHSVSCDVDITNLPLPYPVYLT